MNSIKEPSQHKIDILLKQKKRLFHVSDLKLLWGISNKRTLYSVLGRYTQKGILIPIYRGFYSVLPLSQIDPIELGSSALHSYCYLSTESVLAQHGIIFQQLSAYTFCAPKNKQVHIGNLTFRSRQLTDKYLFNEVGINNEKHSKIATLERAVADMLYFNPRYHFDNHDSINWSKVKKLQREISYL